MGIAVQKKLVLTGGRAGQTCVLGGYQFVNGITLVMGDSDNISGLVKYMGRSFKAFEDGSAELAYYQKLDKERENGTGQVHAGAQRGGHQEVQPGVRQGGTGPSTVSADDSGGADDAAQGSAGPVPGGAGHSHPGNDGPRRQQAVLAAIKRLEHTNVEHWTTDGLPRVDAVATLLGDPNVTRGLIEKSAPGFDRAAARMAAAQ